ncbi:MAG: glycosyltransferase family protein [Desulfitobacteriaceae bacterium]
MPTIIYPPSIPWNWMFQRPQQLMRQFAALGYTVLYEDLGHFPTPQIHKLSPTFTLCQGVSALTLPHPRPHILWLTVPSHIGLAHTYSPDIIVYDAVDEPKEEFASWAPYYSAILEQAHLIFASARSIYESLSTQHPNVHLIPNGVDFAHFSSSSRPRPSDLPADKPIVGYSGAIAPWLDWDLLKHVIRKNPDLRFIFIGALFNLSKFPLREPNTLYLGLKPYSQLPAYLKYFKAGLIPFKITEMTKGCNPIKLFEYFAAGLPVLGTPLPELLNIPGIDLDIDPDRFAARLHQIVNRKDPGKHVRTSFAQANDWSERAREISRHIDEAILRRA